jgi:hypothetical protein
MPCRGRNTISISGLICIRERLDRHSGSCISRWRTGCSVQAALDAGLSDEMNSRRSFRFSLTPTTTCSKK